MLAIAREYVALGHDPLKEIVVEFVGAAVVGDLEQFNLDLAVLALFQQASELEPFEDLVTARIAGEQLPLAAASASNTRLDRFGTDSST